MPGHILVFYNVHVKIRKHITFFASIFCIFNFRENGVGIDVLPVEYLKSKNYSELALAIMLRD